ncbi:hypothetical protein GBA52_020243 [Prunus armeniaca]|nr:hypothetical protein GBA52_020243 [Prunus armeniaca]
MESTVRQAWDRKFLGTHEFETLLKNLLPKCFFDGRMASFCINCQKAGLILEDYLPFSKNPNLNMNGPASYCIYRSPHKKAQLSWRETKAQTLGVLAEEGSCRSSNRPDTRPPKLGLLLRFPSFRIWAQLKRKPLPNGKGSETAAGVLVDLTAQVLGHLLLKKCPHRAAKR